MKYISTFTLLILTLFSCQKDTIEDAFGCNTPSHFTNSKNYHDVLKKFNVDIPKNWKTELYFDEYQSEVYSADTTKQLSESYIIDIAWHQGSLVFNEDFEQKIIQNLNEIEHLEIVQSGYGKFVKYNSYYNLSVGKNSDITYHYLQIYLQYENDAYYIFTSKIYGDEFVNERICSSVSLFKNITFIE
jgi:hypothetical protein